MLYLHLVLNRPSIVGIINSSYVTDEKNTCFSNLPGVTQLVPGTAKTFPRLNNHQTLEPVLEPRLSNSEKGPIYSSFVTVLLFPLQALYHGKTYLVVPLVKIF